MGALFQMAKSDRLLSTCNQEARFLKKMFLESENMNLESHTATPLARHYRRKAKDSTRTYAA